MIQAARGNPAVMMVQPSLHGRMALVHGIEMADPATHSASADANSFRAKVQALACCLRAGMPIGDDRAIPGQPFRHRWNDVSGSRRREGFHIGRPAAGNRRQDRPLLRPWASPPAIASPLSRQAALLQRPVSLSALQKTALVPFHDAFQTRQSDPCQESDTATETQSGRRIRSARPIDAVSAVPAGIPQA